MITFIGFIIAFSIIGKVRGWVRAQDMNFSKVCKIKEEVLVPLIYNLGFLKFNFFQNARKVIKGEHKVKQK